MILFLAAKLTVLVFLDIITSEILYLFMEYRILANKWRPKNFYEVVGQQHVLTTIKNSFVLGYIHNVYLLSGIHGIGKTTLARLIAKGLNCNTSITYNPCNKCSNCVLINKLNFPDLIEIDAASKTRIEDIRDILENIQYIPTIGRFKVYIIDEVHMLSRYSFNALLKTLEETPKHVKFILATTNYFKIPLTITSRCLQLHLKLINDNEIINRIIFILDKENIKYEKYAIQEIVHNAYGSMRHAINLIDQAILIGNKNINSDSINKMLGYCTIECSISILEYLFKNEGNTLIKHINKYESYGADWNRALDNILLILHKLAMYIMSFDKLENDIYSNDFIKRIKSLSKYVTFEKIQNMYQNILITKKNLKYNPNMKIGIDIFILRLLYTMNN